MLIPRFWAEGRLQVRKTGKQVTVRRWGWSNLSQADAQRHADERAAEAMAAIQAGNNQARREPKVPYNGADGVPIREEILEQRGSAILTRNSYGAVCLNTPNVMFIDLDPEETYYVTLFHSSIGCLVTSFASYITWLITGRIFLGVALFIGMTCCIYVIDRIRRLFEKPRRKDRLQVIAEFASQKPEWRFRVYRTPRGYRLLVLHRTFDPNEAEVTAVFKELESDLQYVLMCQKQQCFRARVSPKPWNIGIADHIKPRRGIYPVPVEVIPERLAWISDYEARAQGFAACRFVIEYGDAAIHPNCAAVRDWHDELCRADADRPIG